MTLKEEGLTILTGGLGESGEKRYRGTKGWSS